MLENAVRSDFGDLLLLYIVEVELAVANPKRATINARMMDGMSVLSGGRGGIFDEEDLCLSEGVLLFKVEDEEVSFDFRPKIFSTRGMIARLACRQITDQSALGKGDRQK